MTTIENAERSRAPLVALLAAQGISVTGNMLTLVAVPWFVLQTTGSPAKTGLAGFFAALPVLISGPFGGVLVDRMGHRRASIVSDLVSSATVALIPILFLTWGLEFWQLLALVFLGALLDVPGGTARASLLPELAEKAGVSMEKASSAADGAGRVARMLGAPLAGLLIAALGATNVLFVNAATFLVSAALMWAVVPQTGLSRPDTASSGYLSDLKEGMRFVARDPLLRAIVLMLMVANFLDHATFAVIFPVYADRVLGGAVDLGLLFGAFGVGAVAGTAMYGAFGHRLPRRTTLLVAFLIVGGPRFFLMAAEPGLIPLVVAMFFVGITAGPINPILLVVEYERIPGHMRGRVFGLVKAVAWGAMPLGALAAGYVVGWLGLSTTLIAIGGVYLLVTVITAIAPAWREMDPVSPGDLSVPAGADEEFRAETEPGLSSR